MIIAQSAHRLAGSTRESLGVATGFGAVVVPQEGEHDEAQRSDIERIIDDIQDFIGNNHEGYMIDGSDSDDSDSDDCNDEGFYECEDLGI